MQYRPWVRWWWNGNKVDSSEIVRELNLLHLAGIGGVEINPIEFPSRCDDQGISSLTWLSDEWIDALRIALQHAQSLGMGCDLLVGSGWPFGTEDLPREDRAQVMLTYALEVEGNSHLELSSYALCQAVDPDVTVTNPSRTCEIMSVKLVPNPMNSMDDVIDVTDRLKDGILNLQIPQGPHMLYTLVKYESFASVINGAPGAAGPIVDHMNADAVSRYLRHMSNRLVEKLGPMKKWLRAYFVDSMELEGSNWTHDFAAEFIRRRGYDVMPYLPFIMFKVGRLGNVDSYQYGAQKSPELQEILQHVRYDFEQTKAELLHERYTTTFLNWCQEQGVKSRAQAYGRGFFPLESSLNYDIPEGESWTTNYLRHRIGYEMGNEDYRRGRAYTMINKYVSSAAHLSNHRLVSAEEMTNTYMLFNTTLELLKLGSDMNAFAGITHSVWHGFNYNPPQAGFPGWVQYGSYLNEQNTWWPYFYLLNDYRARMSSLLQNSDMATNIAILTPTLDLWAEVGVQTEPFPQYPKGSKYSDIYLLWEAVQKNGGNCDLISDQILAESEVKDGTLCYHGKRYSVLLIPQIRRMSKCGYSTLQLLAREGTKIVCIGNLPDLAMKESDRLISQRLTKSLVENPLDGDYLQWYRQLQTSFLLPHAVDIEHPDPFLLQSHHHTTGGDEIFLFTNAHLDETLTAKLTFSPEICRGRYAWQYDASDGSRRPLILNKQSLTYSFDKGESLIVVFDHTPTRKIKSSPTKESTDTLTINHWKLTLHHTIEGWDSIMVLDTLKDLRETSFASFCGTVSYQSQLSLDRNPSHPIHLRLESNDICQLFVNGHDCGVRWFGTRQWDIDPQYLHTGTNIVEISATTLLGNYARTLTENGVVQHFVTKRNQPTVPMGITHVQIY